MAALRRTFKILLLSILGFLWSPMTTNAHGDHHHAGDITLPPYSFNLDFLDVFYEFNSDNTITMAIKCNIPNQYFSVGLGVSMLGADLWVFELVDNEVIVNDYRGEYHTYPTLDTSAGGQNDLIRLGYEITAEYSIVKFKRALDTRDTVNDKPIQLGLVSFIYATGPSPLLAYHDRRGITQVILEDTLEQDVQNITAGDVTLPPNSFYLEFLTVYYEFNSDNTITMAIQCHNPNQYFALGLGTSMFDSDIWVFELVDNEVTVNDYRGEYHTYPTLDTSVGGQNDLVRLGYEITSEYSLVKIKRALDTGDAVNDKPIQPGPVAFLYATGPSRVLEHHDRRGIAEVVLVGQVDEEVEEEAPILEEENQEIMFEEEQEIAEELFVVVELDEKLFSFEDFTT